ncbi:unnamed protein product, partial [Prorocentrum cordatum]
EGDRDARAKAFAPKGGGAVEGAGQAHSGTPPASPARGPQPAAPGGPRPARRRRRPRWRPRRQAPAPPAAGIAGARSGGLPPSSGPPSGRPAAQAGPRGGSTRRRGRSTSRTARRRGGCGSGSWSPGCETFSQASSSALKAPTSRPSVNDSALVTLPMAAASSAGSCPARTASQLHRSELFPSSGCGTRPCSTSARPRSADCPGPGRPGTPRARQRPRGRAPCSEEGRPRRRRPSGRGQDEDQLEDTVPDVLSEVPDVCSCGCRRCRPNTTGWLGEIKAGHVSPVLAFGGPRQAPRPSKNDFR